MIHTMLEAQTTVRFCIAGSHLRPCSPQGRMDLSSHKADAKKADAHPPHETGVHVT